jgi:putative phosphotransacetylase
VLAKVPIFISARHVHLKKEDVKALFGDDYLLQKDHDIGQKGQFACKETVTLVGPKGEIEEVRILGPERNETQVKISKTDGIRLGITPPLKLSGELENTPGIKIVGHRGFINLRTGVIEAKRHIHMSTNDALDFNVKNGDIVMVEVDGERGIIFDDVVVRVDENFVLEMHIDTDEANAADIQNGELGTLITKDVVVHPEGND